MQKGGKSQTLILQSGARLRFTGPPLTEGPLPGFLYLFTTDEQSLDEAPVNGVVQELADAPLRCFSITIPAHGPDLDPTKGIARWASAFEDGQDLIEQFSDHCYQIISELIEDGILDPDRLVLGGLSRGAFLATHLAARWPKLKGILGFAPLTRLDRTPEFSPLSDQPLIKLKNLTHLIPALVGKPLRYYIGNRDERVSTDACYELVRELTEASFEAKLRSPPVELIISPSIGHRGHGTGPDTFASGARWLRARLLG